MKYLDKKDLTKTLSSFIIGDGHLSKSRANRNDNSYLQIEHRTDHKDYIEYKREFLNTLTATSIYEYSDYIRLRTMRHPIYTKLRNRWYIDGKKVISPHDLKLMDAEFLSILYMDDGCLLVDSRKKSIQYGIQIATNGFSWADVKLLRDCIAEKFDVHFNVNSHTNSGFILRTRQYKQVESFVRVVESFIVPSYLYKINISQDRDSCMTLQECDIVRASEESEELDRNDLVLDENLE